MKALGIKDIFKFDYIQKPSKESSNFHVVFTLISPIVMKALENLLALGALTSTGDVSEPLGKQMAELPLDPPYGKVLLMSKAS